jgi:NADPH2:quinone reductase
VAMNHPDDRSARAARLRAHGEPLAVETVSLPAPGAREVAVELRFAGVNPVDRYAAEGLVAPDGRLPRTLGGEAAGTLQDGQAVLVAGGGLGAVRDGVWASAAVVPEEAVVELPAGVSVRDAAAMGVAGLTAYKCVAELAAVGAGDRVLVLGASGGVGSMIVSLAAARGAEVVGQTGSEAKEELIRGQGAARVIVCDADGLAGAVAGLEPTVVFDPLGNGFVPAAVDALAPHGKIVSFGTSGGAEVAFNLQALYRKGGSILGYAGMLVGADERRAGLRETLRALAEGELRVRIDEVLPLGEVNDALARLAARDVQGKLLLDLTR